MCENLLNKSKEELKEWFTTNNKSGYKTRESWLKKNHPELHFEINNIQANSFIERILIYLMDLNEIPKCLECNNNVTYLGSINRGFSKFCSITCSNKSIITNNKRKIKYSSKEFIIIKEKSVIKRKKTNLKKYGVDNPMKNLNVKNKLKKTNIKKYGVSNVFKSEKIKNKIKETNLKKYGVKHLSKIPKYHKNKTIKMIKTVNNLTVEKVSKKLSLNTSDVSYNGNNFLIKNYCNKHPEFIINKNNYYSRNRFNVNVCTKCNPISDNRSISEVSVLNFCEDIVGYKLNKKIINNREIDIYIPEYNIGFEYDGLYWHSDKFYTKNEHLNKTQLAEKNGIKLYHIFEDEWIYKRKIVKSIIRNKLNSFDWIYDVKCCDISEIYNIKQIKKFYYENFIYNIDIFEYNIGLYNNNDLISIITIKKIKNNSFEIIGYCNKLNTNIKNGFDEMLLYFIEKYKPKEIVIKIDVRYNNNTPFLNFKFKKIYQFEPQCWFFNRNKMIRYSIINNNLNENIKIFDCGKSVFKLEL